VPNVRSQTVQDNVITIVCAGNGNVCTLTKAQLQAFYQTTSGTAAQRKALVITWGSQQLAAQSGGALSAAQIVMDFNDQSFTFSSMETHW